MGPRQSPNHPVRVHERVVEVGICSTQWPHQLYLEQVVVEVIEAVAYVVDVGVVTVVSRQRPNQPYEVQVTVVVVV